MSLNVLYSFNEGVKGLKRVPMATVITITTIAVTQILFGLFLFFTVNVHYLINEMRNKVTLEVFIDAGLSDKDQKLLGEKISSFPGVASVKYVSKEEALKVFSKESGIDPLSILGENPLPSSYHITVTNEKRTPDEIEKIKQGISDINGVDEVVYNSTFYKLISKYSSRVLFADGLIFGLVVIVTILLVANTLRLSILTQKKTIEIMQLVGASKKFIRMPYLLQGMFQGLIGGVFGSVAIIICVIIVKIYFPRLFTVSLPAAAVPPLLGMILGYIGSSIALRRYLAE